MPFSNHATDETGCTKALEVDGKNILNKWGLEFSDGTFFFQHGKAGSAKSIVVEELNRSRDQTSGVLHVALEHSAYQIHFDEHYSSNVITRNYRIECIEEGSLLDFAISQGFPKESFSHALIAEKKIPFDNLERNHQFETNQVILSGNRFDLRFSFEAEFGFLQFVPVMYVRTSNRNGWVVHARLFPKNPTQKTILLCRPSWTGKIPFSGLLSSIRFLTDYLWYAGEKPELVNRKTLGFSSFGLVKVPKGSVIRLSQTIELTEK